jgi:rhodanese-related sulfurtransferase
MKPDLLKFFLDNIFLIAVAFVSGAMLLWPVVRRGAGGAAVNTLEATQLINRQDALVVDVRSAEEFRNGHILNARNVPLPQLESRLADLDRYKQKPVIVACETGSRSGAAASVLRKHGFAQVFNLSGGTAAWQQAGLPVEK